jgi:peptidoglycan/LPS O-acetylase OafA/YrhL
MTAAPPLDEATAPQRIDALDGVRGIAILLVVVMHALYVAPLIGVDLAGGYARATLLGWCGVDVFFVLSGFLITGILVRAKGGPHYFRNFYMRRMLRIFPLYYVVIALLLWVLPRPPAPPDEQLTYLLYVQNFRFAFGDYVLDPARLITWSLAIEEQFYLVWPALVWFVSRKALAVTCAIVIAGAIALRFVLLDAGVAGTHFVTLCRMDALAAGALLAITPAPGALVGWALALVGVAGLGATAALTGASVPESIGQQRWGLLAALAFGVGLLVLARRSRLLRPLFELRVLRSLGKYSYCIYLTHLLVIENVTRHGWLALPGAVRNPLLETVPPIALQIAFTGVFVLASWLVGCISWHAFEKWLLALKRYFPSGSPPSA